jgi:hypothetical protein
MVAGMNERLEPYRRLLDQWLPGARLTTDPEVKTGPGRPDAFLRWTTQGQQPLTFVVEYRPHLATQDIQVVAIQFERLGAAAKSLHGPDIHGLLLAPFIRTEQAAELRARGIDYIDLVGNVHLNGPGVYVHVEGKRPVKGEVAAPGRLTRGWVKTVMALLVQPELRDGAYRPIAAAAEVAIGTVAACLKDLEVRGYVLSGVQGRTFLNVPDLVALWVQTYGDVLKPRLRVRHLQMRDTRTLARWQRLEAALTTRRIAWALAGADGAAARNSYFQAPETEIYADPAEFDRRDILAELAAQPAVRHGNLRVIEPPGPVAIPPLETIEAEDGLAARPPVCPLLLAYAELRLRRTDQANEAAELILPELLADART